MADNDSYVLFDDPTVYLPPRPPESVIDQRFLDFHTRNPHVYNHLVQLAREAKQGGCMRIGIKMLWEVVRWKMTCDLGGDQNFKLPNSYHSRYARLIMQQESDLSDIFMTRPLRS